ncbi:MAG: class I SAM-dependent methyltransferase [Candidatus Shikimatogenerans sp. JK-2022]|nr:class I SAM-dependent methyltransferase [Candidatus Shikimatogenerans bostrichidophilus]MDH3005067.1 class I SAM-dependent methyltransferase [Candidatus Shikimatogenerans bostrichidophilus]
MIINNNFIKLKNKQLNKFRKLKKIHKIFNKKINLISYNSLKNFYINHIEYSLSIINIIKFLPNSEIMDAGTGGGFPGIPLSIIFNNTKFYLIDSIKKKILMINKIINKLKIKNIITINNRIENINKKFDFIISRFLSNINNVYLLLKNNIKKKSIHYIKNGIIYLTGENKNNINIKNPYYILNIKKNLKNNFYKNKKIIYIPI